MGQGLDRGFGEAVQLDIPENMVVETIGEPVSAGSAGRNVLIPADRVEGPVFSPEIAERGRRNVPLRELGKADFR